MANFDKIWKIIKENNFELNNGVSDDLICIICKRLMINASNAPCGCRYCSTCIKEYLNETEKYCPGPLKYCQIDLIKFDRDIFIDRTVNIRISRLTVKCPNETCEHRDELNMIEEHIQICEKKFSDCPYSDIGCCKDDVRLNEMKTHLSNETFSHNKLLIEYTNNLRNEMETLKKDMITLKEENIFVNEQMERNKLNDERKKNELDQEIAILKNENMSMKNEIDLLDCWRTKISIANLSKENEEIKQQLQLIEKKQGGIHLRMDKINNIKVDLNNKIVDISDELSDIKTDLDENSDDIKLIFFDISEMQTKISCEEFVWKIENLSDKVVRAKNKSNKIIYSDSFYSHKNGYKMCLYACPYGLGKSTGVQFGIFFTVMKGSFDDILSWPCKIDVTIDLINQETGKAHTSKTKKYGNNSNHDVYKKPVNDKNDGLGNLYFIKLDHLMNNEQLIKNNQLFIKCTVHVK